MMRKDTIYLRRDPRLPGYYIPETAADGDMIRRCGWKSGMRFSEAAYDELLKVVSENGLWLATPVE